MIVGYTRGEAAPEQHRSALSCCGAPKGTSSCGPETAAPGSPMRRSNVSRQAAAARAGHVAVGVRRRCRASRRTMSWGNPGARLRGRVRRVDAERRLGRLIQGVREDKERRGGARAPVERRSSGASAPAAQRDKVFWPDEGITKGDLLEYYRGVRRARPAPPQPAVHDEALSGRDRRRLFFQKDAPSHMPDWIKTVRCRPDEGRKAQPHHPLSARQRRARADWVVSMGRST